VARWRGVLRYLQPRSRSGRYHPDTIRRDWMTVVADVASPIDSNQLRSLLRLCFPADQAESLAVLLRAGEADPARSLAPVIRAARVVFGTGRFTGALRRGHAAAPLRPRPGLDAEAALALAFHVGLGFDSRLLGSLFGRSKSVIGVDLQRARRFVESERTTPCA